MARPIMNLSEVELREHTHGEDFAWKMGPIAAKLGARKLGYNLTVVPPGKRAFPFHAHRVNEEMFFVLEGEGELRFGDERHAIQQGDVISCPPGGAEVAHQIINTGPRELRYLAVSSRLYPEVVDYPDSKKFGIMAEALTPEGQPFRYLGRLEHSIDYYDGE